jgi:molecular chaperone DnaJ
MLVDRELDIDIPAGIDDRQRIRVRGQGHAGSLAGPPGDLFVEVNVRPEPGIERDGHDLHTAIELTMTEAALGTTVRVPGPVSEIEVDIPPGTQPGHVQTLRFQGMPSVDDRRSGHFHVHVRVRVPRHLDDAQRELVAQLDDALDEDAYRDDEDDGGFFGRIKNAFR